MEEDATKLWSLDTIRAWLMTEGIELAFNLLIFIAIVVASWILSRIVGRVVREALERSKVKPSPLLHNFIINVVRKSMIVLGIIVGLDTLGVDTAALIAGLGAGGLIMGFALKDTLSNFAAGFLLLFYRPFDVGHWVQVAGIEGEVLDLTLVFTKLKTGDNKIITVPNAEVWGKAITNFHAAVTRRIDLVAGIGYADDIPKAKAVLEQIITDQEGVLEDPAPVIRVKELADSSVNFDVRPWVKTDDYWGVRSEILEQIKLRFDAEGIGIPFPQREVWLHEMKDAS